MLCLVVGLLLGGCPSCGPTVSTNQASNNRPLKFMTLEIIDKENRFSSNHWLFLELRQLFLCYRHYTFLLDKKGYQQ